MIRTKSCHCVMLRVTSLWICLTLLETYNYFPLNIHIELSPLSSNIHPEYSYFPLLSNSDRTYIPNNVISLGLQTLNPQQNYFPLKTQTLDYHYPETSKSHTNVCHNSITSTKHDKNDHDTTWNTCGDLISRVNHRYIAFLDRADKHNLITSGNN